MDAYKVSTYILVIENIQDTVHSASDRKQSRQYVRLAVERSMMVGIHRLSVDQSFDYHYSASFASYVELGVYH